MTMEVSTSKAINWNASGYAKIVDNVANILKTKKGEVPYAREMGIDPAYIDSPLSISKGGIISDTVTAIAAYETRAAVEEIDITDVNENGDIAIKVVISI